MALLLDLLPLLQQQPIAKTGGAVLGLEAGGTKLVTDESASPSRGGLFQPVAVKRYVKAGGATIGLHGGGTAVISIDSRAVLRARIRETDELLLVGAL